MEIKWRWLLIMLVVVVVFGSMRQYRIKKIYSEDMTGGVVHGGPMGHHGGPDGHPQPRGDLHPHNRRYGDPYLGSSGWPVWLTANYWWPGYGYVDCVDYATKKCIGAPDYQGCFNEEYKNCPYH